MVETNCHEISSPPQHFLIIRYDSPTFTRGKDCFISSAFLFQPSRPIKSLDGEQYILLKCAIRVVVSCGRWKSVEKGRDDYPYCAHAYTQYHITSTELTSRLIVPEKRPSDKEIRRSIDKRRRNRMTSEYFLSPSNEAFRVEPLRLKLSYWRISLLIPHALSTFSHYHSPNLDCCPIGKTKERQWRIKRVASSCQSKLSQRCPFVVITCPHDQ